MEEKYYQRMIEYLIDQLENERFWREHYQLKCEELSERNEECKKHTGENI